MEKEDAETYALIEWEGQDNIWLKVKDWSFKIALSSGGISIQISEL